MNSRKNILELLSTKHKRKFQSYCIYNVRKKKKQKKTKKKKHVNGTLYVFKDTCLEVEEREEEDFR